MLKKKSIFFRIICLFLAFLLVQNSLEQVQAQGTPFLPSPHSYFLDLSAPYSLPVLRGMRVYPQKPFEFDFMVGSGDRHTIDQKETALLIKYFLTCLTVPEEDLWVNLSPYEHGRIIPDELALTNAGNNLLEQDKLLKQLASSLTYPESRLGKKFWELVYKKAYEKFGTTDLPIKTYNKVWIVPDRAIVYDMGNSALIGDTHLKVMLEEDYLALKKHTLVADKGRSELHQMTSIITKEIILPELEKEINKDKNFAPVRQIFHSMILAAWFKGALKRNVLNEFYVNKKKISGIDGVNKNSKEEIYKQYLRIYKFGAYNYIREDVDPISQQVVPRKYFSGGLFFGNVSKAMRTLQVPDPAMLVPLLDRAQDTDKSAAVARVNLIPIGDKNLTQLMSSQAMNSDAAQATFSSTVKKFVALVGLAVTLSPLAGETVRIQKYMQNRTPSPIVLALNTPPQEQASPSPAPVLPTKSTTAPRYGARIPGRLAPEDIKYVQMAEKLTTLDDVKALNGNTNPLSGQTYNVDIPWMERNWNAPINNNYVGWLKGNKIVAFQHKNGLPENGQLRSETKKALSAAAGGIGERNTGVPKPRAPLSIPEKQQGPTKLPVTQGPSTLSAPQVLSPTVPVDNQNPILETPAISENRGIKNPPAPAAPAVTETPTPMGQEMYTYTHSRLRSAPVEGEVKAKIGGKIFSLNPSKDVHENDILATLTENYINIQRKIEGLNQNIKSQQKALKDLEEGQKRGAVNRLDVLDAKLKLLDLMDQLDDAKTEEANSVIKAPNNGTIYDFDLGAGDSIKPGDTLAKYLNNTLLRYDIQIPSGINYFEQIKVILDDGRIPIKSTFFFNWLPSNSADARTRTLSLILTPESPLTPEQLVKLQQEGVKFSATFYAPGNNVKMPVFPGRASAHAWVDNGNEYRKTATAKGEAKFKVNLGDWVKKGQSIVQIDPAPYQIKLEKTLTEALGTKIKLEQRFLPDGTTPVAGQVKADLEIRLNNLLTQAKDLRETIAGLDIKADEDGVVVWSAQNEAKIFQEKDDLIRINRGYAFLGNLDNIQYASLFSKGLNINVGEKVQVRTPAGLLLAEVLEVNPNPTYSSSDLKPGQHLLDLSGYQSVRFKVYDPGHSLQPGTQVTVTLLTPQGEQQANDLLSTSGYMQFLASPSASTSPPPPDDPLKGFESQYFASTIAGPAIPASPFNYTPPQGTTLQQVDQGVGKNQLLLIGERFNVGNNKAAERLPRAWRLNVTATLFGTNGGVSGFVGGALSGNGLTAGLTGGGIATTPAGKIAQILMPIFGQAIGNAVDFIDGKVAKEVATKVAQTKSSAYSLLIGVNQLSNDVHDKMLELRAVQEKIADSNASLEALNTAHQNLIDLEALELTATHDPRTLKLEGEIEQIKSQITGLESDRDNLISTLNNWRGENIIDGPSIVADVPEFNGNFLPANDLLPQFFKEAAGPNGKDPRLLKAQADLEVVNAVIKEHNLKKLATVNLGALVGNSANAISQLPYEPWLGGGGTWRISTNDQTNIFASVSIPAIDQKTKIETGILSSQKIEAEGKIGQVRKDVEDQLNQTVRQIRELSDQIKLARNEYRLALDIWEGLTIVQTPYQYYPQTLEVAKQAKNLVDLKKQYLKKVEVLKAMGIDTSALEKKNAAKADKAQAATSSSFRKFIISFAALIAFAVNPLMSQSRQSIPPVGTENMIYSSSNPSNAILGGLNASNPIDRQQAMDLFDNYQYDKQSIETLEEFFINQPNTDARQKIADHMVELKDLRFFIQIMEKTMGQESKREIYNLASQKIGEILWNNPEIADTWHLSNFTGIGSYPDLRVQAEKALWAFIMQDPKGKSQTRLLYSQFFQTDDLIRVAKSSDNVDLRELAKKVLVRRIFLDRVDQHFTPGQIQSANSYSWIFGADNIVRSQIVEMPEEYRKFFNSPDWQQNMGLIRDDLLTEAQEEAQRQIDSSSETENSFSTYEVPDLSAPQDSLQLLAEMDPSGQQEFIMKKAKTAELARILGNPQILKSPLLWNLALNRLMATTDGQISVLEYYITAPEHERQLIEGQNWRDIINQEAQIFKNPGTMRIFREAFDSMYRNTHFEWIPKAVLDTYSSMKLNDSLKALSDQSIDPQTRQAQINLVAMIWALKIKLGILPDVVNKDSFIAGKTVYTAQEYENMKRILEKIESLNDPKELEDYLAQNFSANGIEDLIFYRDKLATIIETNDQDIVTGPWYSRALQWAYHQWDFTAGFVLLIGGILFTILPKYFDRRHSRKDSLEELMAYLGKKFLGRDAKRINIARIAPRIRKLLTNWDNELKVWSKSSGHSVEDMLKFQEDSNTAINEMLRQMPYTPELINSRKGKVNNQYYQDSLGYIVLRANALSYALSGRLKGKKLRPDQQERFWSNNAALELKMIEIQKYLDILQGRANTNASVNEQFQDGTNIETANRPTTNLLSYQHLSRRPQKKLPSDVIDLIEIANLIMPGFYQDNKIKAILESSVKRAKFVKMEGKRLQSYGNAWSRMWQRIGSMVSRWWFLLPFFYFLGRSVLGLLTTTGILRTLPLDWRDVAFTAGSAGVAFARYWSPAFIMSREAENETMKEVLVRLHNRMAEALQLNKKVKDWDSFKKMAVQEVQKANKEEEIARLAKVEGEANIAARGRDINVIVLMVENPQDVSGFKQQMERIRQKDIKENVYYKVMPYAANSQDGDAFLRALKVVKQEYDSGVYKINQHEARTMFINVNKDIRPNDPRLESNIINAYGANVPKGGLVMANAKDLYLGSPVVHDSDADMTFGTAWANINQLSDRPWAMTDLHEGKFDLLKIFVNFDLAARLQKDVRVRLYISRIKELLLRRNYNLTHGYSLDHFSSIDGRIVMGPQAINMFLSLADKLEGSQLRLYADLFIPMLMGITHGFEDMRGLTQEIMDYVESQLLDEKVNGNGNGIHHTLEEQAAKVIDVAKRVPHDPRTALYTTIALEALSKGQKMKIKAHYSVRDRTIHEPNPSPQRVLELLGQPSSNFFIPNPPTRKPNPWAASAARLRSSAMTSVTRSRDGGIDLNFQPQFIQQFSRSSFPGFQLDGITRMPDGFKGFNFNIVRFTSELTVNGAFHMMLNSN